MHRVKILTPYEEYETYIIFRIKKLRFTHIIKKIKKRHDIPSHYDVVLFCDDKIINKYDYVKNSNLTKIHFYSIGPNNDNSDANDTKNIPCRMYVDNCDVYMHSDVHINGIKILLSPSFCVDDNTISVTTRPKINMYFEGSIRYYKINMFELNEVSLREIFSLNNDNGHSEVCVSRLDKLYKIDKMFEKQIQLCTTQQDNSIRIRNVRELKLNTCYGFFMYFYYKKHTKYNFFHNMFSNNIISDMFLYIFRTNMSYKLKTPPDEFICPITYDIMENPVYITTEKKYSYEKDALVRWLYINNSSPITRIPCNGIKISENVELRTQIAKWIDNTVQ